MINSIPANRHASIRGFFGAFVARHSFFGLSLQGPKPESSFSGDSKPEKTRTTKPECGGYNEAFVFESWAHYECPDDLMR